MTTSIRAMALAAVLAVGLAPSLGHATAQASSPALSVRVYCYSNPERTVIHNNRTTSITITSVGSLYQPYSNEPFSVYRKLAAGKTITFYTGNGASYSNSNTLTRRYIYSNSVGSIEGVRARSTAGTFIARC